jgi:hypothetical protein
MNINVINVAVVLLLLLLRVSTPDTQGTMHFLRRKRCISLCGNDAFP